MKILNRPAAVSSVEKSLSTTQIHCLGKDGKDAQKMEQVRKPANINVHALLLSGDKAKMKCSLFTSKFSIYKTLELTLTKQSQGFSDIQYTVRLYVWNLAIEVIQNNKRIRN